MEPLEYGRSQPGRERAPVILGAVSCGIGLAGHALAVFAASRLWYAPTGVSIRPMGLSFMIVLIAFGTFCLGSTCAGAAIWCGWRRPRVWLLAVLGLGLCLTPLTSSMFVWHWIVAQKGLIIGD
jgi:hypothetical protein